MNPSLDIIEPLKTSHARSRSSFPIARKPPLATKRCCERGQSIGAIGKQLGCIMSKSAAETLAVGGKRSEQDETEVNGSPKMSLSHMLNSDTSVAGMKIFQRNVIYALNRLMKEAETETEKKVQQKHKLSI